MEGVLELDDDWGGREGGRKGGREGGTAFAGGVDTFSEEGNDDLIYTWREGGRGGGGER